MSNLHTTPPFSPSLLFLSSQLASYLDTLLLTLTIFLSSHHSDMPDTHPPQQPVCTYDKCSGRRKDLSSPNSQFSFDIPPLLSDMEETCLQPYTTVITCMNLSPSLFSFSLIIKPFSLCITRFDNIYAPSISIFNVGLTNQTNITVKP